MEKRLPLFMLFSIVVLVGWTIVYNWLNPPPKPRPKQRSTQAAVQKTGTLTALQGSGTIAAAQGTNATLAVNQGTGDAPVVAAEADPEVPQKFVTLGTLDRQQGARLLVTLTNRGAAIVRVELNRDRFTDQEDDGGYLGHLIPVDAKGGARVQVVGPGTPAHLAGLQAGDVISHVGKDTISSAAQLIKLLQARRPGQKVELTVKQGGEEKTLSVTLRRRPLEVIRPEWETQPVDLLTLPHDPLSMLLTLKQIDKEEIPAAKAEAPADDAAEAEKEKVPAEKKIEEIPGIKLRDVNWEIINRGADFVEMQRRLPGRQLTVVKRYRLAQVPADKISDENFPGYHLMVDVEIHRDADTPIDVAYRLDGPNGLPTEGWWYLSKISRQGIFTTAGIRDIALHTENKGAELVNCNIIHRGDGGFWRPEPGEKSLSLKYMGGDAPYFSAILIPQNDTHLALAEPYAAGTLPKEPRLRHDPRLTNTSCRLTSMLATISRDKPLKHSYQLFTGPKQRALLAQYGPPGSTGQVNLAELIYYGWPIWGGIATLLSHVLHFFAGLGNYGLAIVLLTVCVRACMFPMSRKQALGAQKMQALQPEMKKLSEKYKNDMEKRTKAMQDLYRKHGYNPLSGCLPMFIQLPIFMGLYRALAIDIELRQAPLISEAFGWCTNLAAPDMLFRWSTFMPDFIVSHMGPFFNLLPVVTVGLFIWQQKMFMPPAADEQAAMQQKMMQYMMIFMGYMFFKVPSGLCIYFIASSLWSIAERKMLPKANAPAGAGVAAAPPPAPAKVATAESPAATRRKKRRERK